MIKLICMSPRHMLSHSALGTVSLRMNTRLVVMKKSLLKFTSLATLGVAVCYFVARIKNRKKKENLRGACA